MRTVADGSLGVALFHAGLMSEARAHLAANVDRLAAEFPPTLPIALAYLSMALTGDGDPGEGLRSAEAARESSDQDAEHRHAGATGIVNLATGAALRELDRPADALDELDQAIALLDDDPMKLDLAQARIERGLALAAVGRRAAATVELDRAAAAVAECRGHRRRGGAPPRRRGTRRRRPIENGARGPAALRPRARDPLPAARRAVTRREIAAALFVSFNTVQTHMRSIYRKLGVASRAQAVARARELGLIEHDRSPPP